MNPSSFQRPIGGGYQLLAVAFVLTIAILLKPAFLPSAVAEDPSITSPLIEFFEAARWGKIERLAAALADGMDVNAHDEHGITALRWASVDGEEAAVQFLVNAGAEVNAHDTNGVTSLMMAAVGGHQKIVATLLGAGADVNAMSSLGAGRTALMYAAIKGHHEIVALLLEHGADATRTDAHGQTALDLAWRWKQAAAAATLEAAVPRRSEETVTSS